MARRSSNADGTKAEASIGRLVLASRILMGLMAAMLVITPWTEHYRTFDNFPHGQDVELSVLAFLAFVSLVLVLAQQRRGRLKDAPAFEEMREDVAVLKFGLIEMARREAVRRVSHSPPGGEAPIAYNLPLVI